MEAMLFFFTDGKQHKANLTWFIEIKHPGDMTRLPVTASVLDMV